jgi:hypothetical protein
MMLTWLDGRTLVRPIISSKITLTDSSGNSHTFVKQNPLNNETVYY